MLPDLHFKASCCFPVPLSPPKPALHAASLSPPRPALHVPSLHPPRPALHTPALPPCPPPDQHFTLLPEDFHVIFAQYYGNIQVVSARNALYHKIKEIGAASLTLLNWYEVDLIHPKDEGHKMYADLLINFFQHFTREQIIRRREALSTSKVLDLLYLPEVEAPLPEPLVPHNYETSGGFCAMAEDFKKHVLGGAGWDWVDEGTPFPNGLQHHKWGYVSRVPGSKMTVMIDTSLGGYASVSEGVQVLVAHLKSYEHMGKAKVACVGGCMCMPASMDGHTKTKASITSFAAITVSPSANCILEFENLFETNSGEYKFKVIGLAVHDRTVESNQFYFGSDHDDYADSRASGNSAVING